MSDVLIAFALLASAISANKILLYAMTPMMLVCIRMFVAGIILLIYTTRGSRPLHWAQVRPHISMLAIITLCTTFVPSLLKAYALSHMASAKQAFFGTLDPFVTALLAYILLNERLSWKKWAGILLGFIGALMLIAQQDFEFKAFSFVSFPELAALGAVVIGRYGWIMVQRFLKKEIFGPTQINTITMLLSGVISGIILLFFHHVTLGTFEGAPFSILKSAPFMCMSFTAQLMFFLSYTILIGNVLAYNLYAHVLKKHSATFVSLMSFSVPLFVALYGRLFLSEMLTWHFFASCGVTFLGLLVFYFDEKS